MNVLRIVTLLTLIVITTNAMALEQEGGVRFLVATPQGEFGDNIDDHGFGLALHYGLRPIPALTFGVGASGLIYGRETRRVSLPLVEDFELNTENYLASGFVFLQWRLCDGPVQPYLEGRAGLNYLWTESKLEDDDWWDGDEVARETNYDDFAPFAGGAMGLLIRLSDGDRVDNKPGLYIDVKASCLHGAEAQYLTEGSVSIVNDRPVYEVSESKTDMKTFEVGVVLTF